MADRNLRAIPLELGDTQVLLNELDGPTAQRTAFSNRTGSIVGQRVDAGEPRATAAPPVGVLSGGCRLARGGECARQPLGELGVALEAAPALLEKCVGGHDR